jgi:hypothetical protein
MEKHTRYITTDGENEVDPEIAANSESSCDGYVRRRSESESLLAV